MPADATLVQAQVFGQALLTGKAKIVLPRVAEQHGKRHLVAGAQTLELEQEVRDLREAPFAGGIGALKNDITVLEDVGDVACRPVIHIGLLSVLSG